MPKPTEVSIVSGYFNPLHVGHLDMMEAARALTGYLVVIVNNDAQQVLKKGKVIQPLEHRLRIVRALRVTDDAIASTDQDGTVRQSLALVRERYPDARLTFANGGDRSQRSVVAEADACQELGIELRFGIGGETKADSSTHINQLLGRESLRHAPSSVWHRLPSAARYRRGVTCVPRLTRVPAGCARRSNRVDRRGQTLIEALRRRRTGTIRHTSHTEG
jgi:cytidyltransferase-like protein